MKKIYLFLLAALFAASPIFAQSITTSPLVATPFAQLPCPLLNQGIPFSCQLTATGGVSTGGVYTWSETGSLPSGLSFTSGGLLSGTPSSSAAFPVTFNATDSPAGGNSQSSISLTLQAGTLTGTGPCAAALCLNAASLTVPTSGTTQLTAIGYFSNGSIITLGSLAAYSCPSGVACAGSSVNTSGLFTAGSTTGTATPQESFSGVNATLSLTVTGSGNALSITYPVTTLPNGQINLAYSEGVTGNSPGQGVQATATGGTPPYTWTCSAGAGCSAGNVNVAGLSLSSGGLISGTPTASGAGASTTLKVTDSASGSATVVVSGGITIASLSTLAVTLTPSTILANSTSQATAVGTYSDSSTANLPNAGAGAAFVQSKIGTICCNGGTPTVTTLATPAMKTTTGNMLTVFEFSFPCTTYPVPTDTAGNTYTSTVSIVNCIQMFNAVNITGNANNITTCNFTTANHSALCLVLEHTGVLSSPLDQHPAANTAASGTSCTPNSITTTQANELAIEGCIPNAATSYTLPSGFTARDTTGSTWDISDAVYTATQTGITPSTIYSPSGASTTFLASYKGVSPLTGGVVWTSATPANATISPTGLVTGQAIGTSGTSVITGTVGGVNNTATITVNPPSVTLQSITVTPSPTSAALNAMATFTATGNYSDNSTQNLTSTAAWQSLNTSVATMASNVATCLVNGSTSITATFGGVSGTASLTCGTPVFWSGIVDPTRATLDWQNAGVVGGIPSGTWAQCVTAACATVTSAGTGVTTAQIQAAITSAPSNTYVLLPSGTLTMTAGLILKSNMALRGAGAGSTTLDFSNVGAGSGAATCQPLPKADICFSGDSTALTAPGGTNTATWSGGYTQGTTQPTQQITLSSLTGIGITNGQYIFLDQTNLNADNGNYFVCDNTTFPCRSDDPGATGRTERSQSQTVLVTAGCAVTCNGAGPFTITISPGVYFPNIASAQTPAAWWPAAPTSNAGVENLTLINSLGGQVPANFGMANTFNSWITGVRSEFSYRAAVWIYQSGHNTIQNNYFYGTVSAASQSYGFEPDVTSSNLITQNIFQRVTTPIQFGNGSGNVISYNYEIYPFNNSTVLFPPLSANHDAGTAYNLYEGNISGAFAGDVLHGTGGFHTAFRNALLGWEPGFANALIAVQLIAYNRFWNIVGNVLGTPGITALYQATGIFNGQAGSGIYILGLAQTAGRTVPFDSKVATTLLRWGNYDSVNGAARFLSSEVPSTISPYGNAVPANNNLSASFYLSGPPARWPAGKPFPPIGPDVTGGNVGQCTSGTFNHAFVLSATACAGGTFTAGVQGGHINSNPAMDCYFNNMAGTTDGTGPVLVFNPSVCY